MLYQQSAFSKAMEKRLNKLHLKKEKVSLGCSWSFSHVFGATNHNLLTNDSREPIRRKSTDIDDRQQMKNNMDYEKSLISMPLGLLLKKHKKTMIPSNKDEFFQCLTSSDKHIITKMMEEFRIQENGAEYTRRNTISPLNRYEMKMLQMRVKAYVDDIDIDINRRRRRCKNDVNHESRQFFEAADGLNLNMDLFLKVLQDPYPVFVKHIKNLQFLPRNRKSRTKAESKDAKVSQTSEDVYCHCSSHQKGFKKDKGQIKRASFSSLKDIFTRKIRENKNKCVSTRKMLAISSDEVHHRPVEMKPARQKVDIFMEAKRRLSERLKTVDSRKIKEAPRTLKMILSSRDSDTAESITLKGHHNFDSDKKRSSLYTNHEILKTASFPVFSKQDEDTSMSAENTSSIPGARGLKHYDCSDGMEEINEAIIERQNLTSDDDYAPDASSNVDICTVQITENNDEKEEYRSPVSVLEPFSFEEAESPKNESELQPRSLSFEDISKPAIYIDEQDPVSFYVRTILMVSGLNLEESSINGPLHPDHLQSYIPSEVDSDIKIILGCINEAIAAVYEGSFRLDYPWKYTLKPKAKVVQEKERFIDEVVKEVNMKFGTDTEKVTVNQLVMKDTITGYSSWIDLRDDAEHILVQLAEDVLHDLIMHSMSEI